MRRYISRRFRLLVVVALLFFVFLHWSFPPRFSGLIFNREWRETCGEKDRKRHAENRRTVLLFFVPLFYFMSACLY